jgi:hypothetical protein
MTSENVNTRESLGWDILVSYDSGQSWGYWQHLTGSRLFRKYKTESVSTLRSPSGGYEYPTAYQRYTFAANGSPCSAEIGVEDWPYFDTTGVHRYRITTEPITSNYIGPYGGSMEYFGVSEVSLRPNIPIRISSRCRNRLIGKVRNQQWDAGQALGEMPATIQALTDRTHKVNRKLEKLKRVADKSLRNRSIYELRKFGNVASVTYLRVIFGILPLLSDIHSLVTTLHDGLPEARFRATVDQVDDSFQLPDPGTGSGFSQSYEGSCRRGLRESATFALADEAWYNAWRLGLTNPLYVSWQLVSLSFVIDWFAHIGSFIQALQQPQGLTFLHGYSTEYVDARVTCTATPIPGWLQYPIGDGDPLVVNILSKGFHREPIFGLIPPLPYLDLDLNLDQLVTGIALILSK